MRTSQFHISLHFNAVKSASKLIIVQMLQGQTFFKCNSKIMLNSVHNW